MTYPLRRFVTGQGMLTITIVNTQPHYMTYPIRRCVTGTITDTGTVELLMEISMKMYLTYILLYMKNMSNSHRVHRRNNTYILPPFKKYVLVQHNGPLGDIPWQTYNVK